MSLHPSWLGNPFYAKLEDAIRPNASLAVRRCIGYNGKALHHCVLHSFHDHAFTGHSHSPFDFESLAVCRLSSEQKRICNHHDLTSSQVASDPRRSSPHSSAACGLCE